MSKDKIDAALVTLFNPKEDVLANIRSYLPYIEVLLIVDNSDTLSPLINNLREEFSKVILLSSMKNIGISKSLNLALNYAKKQELEWLLTMDQDSIFLPLEIKKFIKSFKKIEKEELVIFSPLHNKKFILEEQNSNQEKNTILTSANIINVNKSFNIGGFDEALFIDEVDHEFCLRLKKSNYKIIQNYNCYVIHTLGEKHKSVNINLYPTERIYYMIRNYLYVRKKLYVIENIFFKKRDRYLFKFFIKQFFYSTSKYKYMKMFFKGMIDFKKNRMGYQIHL